MTIVSLGGSRNCPHYIQVPHKACPDQWAILIEESNGSDKFARFDGIVFVVDSIKMPPVQPWWKRLIQAFRPVSPLTIKFTYRILENPEEIPTEDILQIVVSIVDDMIARQASALAQTNKQ